MKKVLFVEDDALVARIYSQKLAQEGFEVVVAEDGLQAMKQLPEFKPDLVVLDLLMPKLTGVDVLKFMRQHPDLKETRVIVFSNSFLSNLIEEVGQIGVEEALVKSAVTPKRLVDVIHRVLDGGETVRLTAEALSARLADFGSAEPPRNEGSEAVSEDDQPASKPESDTDFAARAQREFLERAPVIFKSLRQICGEFLEAGDSPVEPQKLENLIRKMGFLTQMTAMAGRYQLSQLSNITDSCRHTIASTVAFLAQSIERTEPAADGEEAQPSVLLIDDDAVSSRAAVLALGRAKLAAITVNDPFDGLTRLARNSYSVVLLDINMPGMDGIKLCEEMRALPLHKHTPVIFFTAQTDFKTRLRSILSGGDDLITKPILPTELTVKVLMRVLQGRTTA